MKKFSDPVKAIEYLSEPVHVPKSPDKISLAALAKKLRVSYSTLWRIMSGESKNPRPILIESLRKLALAEAKRRRKVIRDTRKKTA